MRSTLLLLTLVAISMLAVFPLPVEKGTAGPSTGQPQAHESYGPLVVSFVDRQGNPKPEPHPDDFNLEIELGLQRIINIALHEAWYQPIKFERLRQPEEGNRQWLYGIVAGGKHCTKTRCILWIATGHWMPKNGTPSGYAKKYMALFSFASPLTLVAAYPNPEHVAECKLDEDGTRKEWEKIDREFWKEFQMKKTSPNRSPSPYTVGLTIPDSHPPSSWSSLASSPTE